MSLVWLIIMTFFKREIAITHKKLDKKWGIKIRPILDLQFYSVEKTNKQNINNKRNSTLISTVVLTKLGYKVEIFSSSNNNYCKRKILICTLHLAETHIITMWAKCKEHIKHQHQLRVFLCSIQEAFNSVIEHLIVCNWQNSLVSSTTFERVALSDFW